MKRQALQYNSNSLISGKKEYNYCLDFLKGIACIFVVFMHCEFPGTLGEVVQCISRFSVPLFFMISGYYYFNNKNLSKPEKSAIAKRKIKHLLRIILLALIIYIALGILNGGISISGTQIVYFLCMNQPFVIVGQMWFLFALLYDYLIFALIDRYNLQRKAHYFIPILIAAYIALAQVANLAGIDIPNMYYRNFLIEGMAFFLLGNWMHYKKDSFKFKNSTLLIIVVVCTCLCVVERYVMGRSFGVNIVTFPQVFALFLLGVNNPQKFKGNLLCKIGKNLSMLVYIFHPAIWHLIDKVYEKVNLDTVSAAQYIEPVLVLLITIVCAIIYNFFKQKIIRHRHAKLC